MSSTTITPEDVAAEPMLLGESARMVSLRALLRRVAGTDSTVLVQGADAEKLLKLMESLEEHDDVAKVFSNFDIDAETMAAVTG